jgi:hypothetical protein
MKPRLVGINMALGHRIVLNVTYEYYAYKGLVHDLLENSEVFECRLCMELYLQDPAPVG